MKFAFVINVEGVTPETYSTVLETPGSYNLVAGVDGPDAAKAYIKKLISEGFTRINLSGDFNSKAVEEMYEIVGDDIEISQAMYTIDELIKINYLESFRDYALIIRVEDIEKPHEAVLRSKYCDTRIIFVKDIRQARAASKKLLEKRVDYIELCSWFDLLRLLALVKETGNRVPIGTCGELDPTMIE